MQNLVLLIDSSDKKSDISLKAGKMCLNRFCIDEEAAFELSGVNYLNIRSEINRNYAKKGKEYSIEQHTFVLFFIVFTRQLITPTESSFR